MVQEEVVRTYEYRTHEHTYIEKDRESGVRSILIRFLDNDLNMTTSFFI